MAHYRFVTRWRLKAPLQEIWNAVYDYQHLPQWWKSVKQVRVVQHGTEHRGVGSIFECTWQSIIPYQLNFRLEVLAIEEGKKIKARASGDLVGYGTWLLWTEGEYTIAEYIWAVRTTKPWMNLVAPIAKPIFHWCHDWVMKEGERGLAALLVARPADHLQAEEDQNPA